MRCVARTVKMTNIGQEGNHDRIAGLIFVASVHAVLGYALIIGLGFDLPRSFTGALKVFDVVEELPPPAIVRPAPVPAEPDRQDELREEASASPMSIPPPNVRLVVPPSIPLPPAPRTGAGTVAGVGVGVGAGGGGTGGGGQGSGAGGGPRFPAQLLKGSITGSDYPRTARLGRAEGVVYVRFLVDTGGRARRCVVTGSSGNRALDSTTCRLIERRFRYRPARDAQGRAITDIVVGNQIWWLK